jgi:hypothetical protein
LIFLAVAALRYTVEHLGVNTDTADMLSAVRPFRQAFEN